MPCGPINSKIEEVCIPADVQLLNSAGGDLNAAIEIASMVDTTKVIFKCKSACVIISSRGQYRQACSVAVFGLHQASSEEGTRQALEFLQQDDRIDIASVRSIFGNYPFEKMYNFDAYQAKSMGLVDEVVDCEVSSQPH